MYAKKKRNKLNDIKYLYDRGVVGETVKVTRGVGTFSLPCGVEDEDDEREEEDDGGDVVDEEDEGARSDDEAVMVYGEEEEGG